MSNYYVSRVDTRGTWLLRNVIIWFDGTVRPKKDHHQCTGLWDFDGQFFIHKCRGTR